MLASLKFIFISLLLIISNKSFSQQSNALEIPPYNGNVLNISSTTINTNSILAKIQNIQNIHIAVLILDSTRPESIEQYSMRLAESWKIGGKGKDNGIIITLAVKDKKVRIEVGYGLEGVITDALSKRIIDEYMIPQFKNGNWERGIIQGISLIQEASKGETFKTTEYRFLDENLNLLYITIFFWVVAIIASIAYQTLFTESKILLNTIKVCIIPILFSSAFLVSSFIEYISTPYHMNKYVIYSIISIITLMILTGIKEEQHKKQTEFLDSESKNKNIYLKISPILFWLLIANILFFCFGFNGIIGGVIIYLANKLSVHSKPIDENDPAYKEFQRKMSQKRNNSSNSNSRNSSSGGRFGGGGSSGGW